MTVATVASGTYAIDAAHSQIGFITRHAMVAKVRGTFTEYEGSGYFDADNPENSNLSITIQADSIDTRNTDRDTHLRTSDFFDITNHPTISFISTGIAAAGKDAYKVTGDLSMRGVTKSITFELETTGSAVDPFGNTRMGLEGSVAVNRKDWGLNWNAPLEAGGFLVSEKVTLEFEVSAIQTGD